MLLEMEILRLHVGPCIHISILIPRTFMCKQILRHIGAQHLYGFRKSKVTILIFSSLENL